MIISIIIIYINIYTVLLNVNLEKRKALSVSRVVFLVIYAISSWTE
jgi:hypothetical protein